MKKNLARKLAQPARYCNGVYEDSNPYRPSWELPVPRTGTFDLYLSIIIYQQFKLKTVKYLPTHNYDLVFKLHVTTLWVVMF